MLLILAAAAPGTRAAAQDIDFSTAQIHVQHVQGSVYMLTGPIGNTTVQIGHNGVLVVDTQLEDPPAANGTALRQRPADSNMAAEPFGS